MFKFASLLYTFLISLAICCSMAFEQGKIISLLNMLFGGLHLRGEEIINPVDYIYCTTVRYPLARYIFRKRTY